MIGVCSHERALLSASPMDAMRGGSAPSSEASAAIHSRLALADELYNAWITCADVDRLQVQLAEGGAGPLAGVPIAIKDNICTSDLPTTCASRMLANYRPSWDATVVARLRDAGAVLVGKTNLDEFGMGSTNEFSASGATRNPWDPRVVAGGSSGGSAAVVACGAVPAALGSDTGGSVRVPAAFCGVVGLKPSYGRVSRSGLVAHASSMDCVGVFALSVRDAARILQAIAGHDPCDATTAPAPVPDFVAALADEAVRERPLRIALPRGCWDGVAPEIAEANRVALRALEKSGATLTDVDWPELSDLASCYYLLAAAEASSNLARFDGVHFGYRAARANDYGDLVTRSRSEGFGPEVRRRILLGTSVLSAGYGDRVYDRAQRLRAKLRLQLDAIFAEHDVLALPTTPMMPPACGAAVADAGVRYALDRFTVAASLAGLPAISVPVSTEATLPVGLQMVARRFDEVTLLQAAQRYELLAALPRRFPGAGRAAESANE